MVFLGLVVGAAVAILFWVFPDWDLRITGWFWDPAQHAFPLSREAWAKAIRVAGNYVPWLAAGPAFAALVLKLVFPRKAMFMPARAALFLAFTMAVGPGLVVNGILKDDWGRPRPVHTTPFGGNEPFNPWYELDGTCPRNCSFVSGEGSLGTWMLAPASLMPPPVRPWAYGAALAFAATTGGLRIAFGGHFFTDVIFSMVLTLVIIALTRWFLFSRAGAADDAIWEARIGRLGLAIAAMLGGLRDLLRWAGGLGAAAFQALQRRFPLPRRRPGL